MTIKMSEFYRFGDVVKVTFPFDDKAESKLRPAVIVSSDLYHRHRPNVLVMALSSRLPANQNIGEFIVNDLKQAGLDRPTRIKAVIASASNERLREKIGSLSAMDQESLRHLLHNVVG